MIPRVGLGGPCSSQGRLMPGESQQMSLSRIPVFSQCGETYLLIDFSRHNNEQRCSFQYSPNPDYIGSEDRKFDQTPKCQLSCSTVETYNDVLFSCVWQAEIFSVPFLFFSPNSQPSDSQPLTLSFCHCAFHRSRRVAPYLS